MGNVRIMDRRTPAGIATALDHRLTRRLARGAAGFVERLLEHDTMRRMPYAITARLRRLAHRAPPRIRVHGPGATGRQLLLVGHDLSRSGAPQLLLEIARLLVADGAAVTLATPEDGPLREPLVAAGVTVVIDPLLLRRPERLLPELAGAVDAALCNTFVTAPAVAVLAPGLPVIWYVHEVSALAERLTADASLRDTLALPARLWAGSELSATLLRKARADVEVVPYGLDPIATRKDARPVAKERPVRLAVLASIEPRKGQDLLLAAIEHLSDAERGLLEVAIHGRTLDTAFGNALHTRAETLSVVSVDGALDTDGYRAAVLACDAVVVPSRDDTLPLVSLDALGAGRLLICTRTTGTAAYLENGISGFVAPEPTAAAIAATLAEAIARVDDWPTIAAAGRAVFARSFSKDVFAARLRDTLATIAS